MNSDNQNIQPQNPTEENKANGNGQKDVSQTQAAETEFD